MESKIDTFENDLENSGKLGKSDFAINAKTKGNQFNRGQYSKSIVP